jgi:hypothetical protein
MNLNHLNKVIIGNMTHKEWLQILANWEASKKLKQLQAKKKEIMSYKLTRKELQNIINDIFEYDSLSDEDKEALDFINDIQNVIPSKDALTISLTKTLIVWHFYLYKYEKLEEYEMCAQLRDVIKAEIKEYNRVLKVYLNELEDEQEIEDILEMVRSEVKLNSNSNA